MSSSEVEICSNCNHFAASKTSPQYAGFWPRFVAAVIDSIILGIGFSMIVFIIIFAWPAAGKTNILEIVGIVIVWFYYALMESSSKQATIGKMAMRIIVTGVNGNRISFFGKATGRHFAKIISFLPLYIGFIMAGFTKKKQALHDLLAGTLVVRKP